MTRTPPAPSRPEARNGAADRLRRWLDHAIETWRRPRRLDPTELSPHLLRDIGLSDDAGASRGRR